VEIVRQLEAEGQFPQAHYAFDNGVLTLELTRLIESRGKHWVSEVEVSRHIQWQGHWRRVDEVGAELRHHHPESFRPVKVSCRNGEEKVFFAFTKGVRLKRYGRKRLVIVHEQPDLSDAPRFLVTDALHWESGRVIQTWSYRWASEVLHEKGQAGMWLGVSSGTPGGSGHTPLPLEVREPCRWSNAHLPQSRNPKDMRLPQGRKPTVRSAERSTGRHYAPCWNYASGILPRANPAMKCWRH
jgi:hypothetical protein